MSTGKKKRSSLALIIIGFFVLLLNLIGIGVSSFFAAKKCISGTNFTDSYNIRYEFDPYSKTNSPADGYDSSITLDDVTKNMDTIANNYSNILMDEGINTSNVYPEVYTDSNGIIRAYLNVTVDATQVKTYKPGAKDDEKELMAPSIAYYSNLESADWTVLYSDGYIVNDSSSSTNDDTTSNFSKAKLYLWNLIGDGTNYLTDSNSKITIDSTSRNNIDIHLANGYSFGKKNDDDKYADNSIKKQFADAKTHNDGDKPDDNATNDDVKDKFYPFMYIIHDLRGMLNACEYYVYLGERYSAGVDEGSALYKAWWQLTDDERNFANAVIKDDANGAILRGAGSNDYRYNCYTFDSTGGFQTGNDVFAPINGSSGYTPTPIPTTTTNDAIVTSSNEVTTSGANNLSFGIYNGPSSGDYNNFQDSYILSYIQEHDTQNKCNPKLGTSTSVKYQFLNKYIIGIVTTDNYTTYLPDKNPTKNSKDSDGEWLVIPNNGYAYTTSMLHHMMTDYRFPYVLMDTSWPGTDSMARPTSSANILNNGLSGDSNDNVALIENQMTNSGVGITSGALTTFICLLIIALVIGIIVSVLYRIPGLVGWLCMLTPISLSLLIMFAMNFAFTFSTAMSMVIILLVQTIALFNILNRIKRSYLGHMTLDQALLAGFNKSFFISLDLMLIPILLGSSVLFFSLGALYAFGVGLITGGLLGWVFTYFLNYGINFLIFNNGIGMYKYSWLTSVKITNNQELDHRYENPWANKCKSATNLGFNKEGYISRINGNGRINNTWMLNKWITLGFWIVAAVILAVGLSLLFTVGVPQSFSFYGGTRIMFYNDGTININSIIDVLNSHGSWHNLIDMGGGNFVFIESSSKYDYATVMSWFSDSGISLPTAFYIQAINVTATISVTKNAIYMALIFLAFITVYSLIRYNWISLISTILLNGIGVLLTLSFTVLFQIPFDINIVYVVFLMLILANVWLFSLYNASMPRWLKKDHPFGDRLRYLMLYGLCSYNDNQLMMIILGITTPLICMLFMPHQTISIFGIAIISIICFGLIINLGTFYLVFLLMNAKNIYHDHVKQVERGTNKRNLDKVDEELIQGININARAIE